jgi:predicted transcriptional regulator
MMIQEIFLMSMRTADLKQGDLENIIMNALWNLESKGHAQVFVSDVQDDIRTTTRQWAYTTVKTVMDRLVEKGMANRIKEGKKFYYNSLVTREASGYTALKKLTFQYFKGDLDDLQSCVALLRTEGFGIVPASRESRETLERVFQASPDPTVTM